MNVSQKLNGTNNRKICVIILSYNNVMWWAGIYEHTEKPDTCHFQSTVNESHKQFAGIFKKNQLYQLKAKFSTVHMFVPGQSHNFSESFFFNFVVLPALLFVYAATGSPVII